MDIQKLIYNVTDGVAAIRMNSPENLNAIDQQMVDELFYVLDQADKDPEVRVVVLKGGKKAFSAGGDVGFFYKLVQDGGKVNMDDLITGAETVANKIKTLSKLVITSVNGAAAGAGASLALAGDFMVCAGNAKLILAFVNLGLVPDMGAVYLLSKSIGVHRTLELAVTGRPVNAREAKELGLAYKVVPPEDLERATMELAQKLAAGPLIAYKNIKKQIYDANFSDYRKWLAETEFPAQAECSAADDFQEGVRAFVEKRTAIFEGK